MPGVQRIAIIGGGYAGLAAATALSKSNEAELDVHLFDQHASHLLLTDLHKTVHSPLSSLQVPFQSIARRYRFTFHQQEINETQIQKLIETQRLACENAPENYHFIVIATGSKAIEFSTEGHHAPVFLNESSIKERTLHLQLERVLTKVKNPTITIVGLGPTGIQFLFELDDHLKRQKVNASLRILGLESRFLPTFNEAFHKYILKRCNERHIEVLFEASYLKPAETGICIDQYQKKFDLNSDLTFFFAGVKPHPQMWQADRFGRHRSPGQISENVFIAGDCSHFEGAGLNRLTAQAAVRKGKIIAANIERALQNKPLKPYGYKEMGYFISLGNSDGIGWLLWPTNIVTGLPAFAIKEAIEFQFRLLLDGIDTYFF